MYRQVSLKPLTDEQGNLLGNSVQGDASILVLVLLGNIETNVSDLYARCLPITLPRTLPTL